MGFAVGHINSLSSPLAWGVLWQFDFFYFFSEACAFANETNTVGGQKFVEPSPVPDFAEATSEM